MKNLRTKKISMSVCSSYINIYIKVLNIYGLYIYKYTCVTKCTMRHIRSVCKTTNVTIRL